jgi:colicin import membrane protein
MPRKLKTFQTSLGFYDLAIAAPSMKAALEAWGAGSTLFHQGFAKETEDADVVAATMSKPGVVLRRPAGSNGRFGEDADLPTDLGGDEVGARREGTRSKANKRRPPKISESAARKAALEFEREQKRREAEPLREEASRRRARERRQEAVAKAQAALDEAREKHEAKASTIEAERAEVEKRAEDEKARWEKQKEKLQTALREARN